MPYGGSGSVTQQWGPDEETAGPSLARSLPHRRPLTGDPPTKSRESTTGPGQKPELCSWTSQPQNREPKFIINYSTLFLLEQQNADEESWACLSHRTGDLGRSWVWDTGVTVGLQPVQSAAGLGHTPQQPCGLQVFFTLLFSSCSCRLEKILRAVDNEVMPGGDWENSTKEATAQGQPLLLIKTL